MNDELLIDLGYALQASKRIEYKERLKKQCQSYIQFIQDKGMLVKPILVEGDILPDDFKLMESDLTGLGIEFFDKIYMKWATKVDKGSDPENVSYLGKAYKKM